MSKPFVGIVMGSDSDLPPMEATFAVLKSFGIPFEARITSAHRTPEVTKTSIVDAESRGCAVFIAAAGMAAQILAVSDPALAQKLLGGRAANAQAIRLKDEALQVSLQS